MVVDFPEGAAGRRRRGRKRTRAGGRGRTWWTTRPDEVINWSYDETGGLEWVVLRTSCLQQAKVTDAKWEQETRWIYYDRENFQIYRKAGDGTGRSSWSTKGGTGWPRRAGCRCSRCRCREGLWLMNKAALAAAGALQQVECAVVGADDGAVRDVRWCTRTRSGTRWWARVYYIQLGKDDRFGWTEPEGKVYQIAADNLVRLKEEIYRVCYLMNQAGTSSGGDLRMSGLSKQRDFSVTQEVLRAYGDAVKDTMKQVLRAIAEARQDEVSIDVSGLDEFDIGDFSSELDDAKKLLELGIASETLKKQVFKKLAFKYLCDARQEVKNRIAEEIDAGRQSRRAQRAKMSWNQGRVTA